METTNTKCDGTCGMVCDCYDASIAGSAMAIALDIAMACDTAAQDRYLAIYGVPYVCQHYWSVKFDERWHHCYHYCKDGALVKHYLKPAAILALAALASGKTTLAHMDAAIRVCVIPTEYVDGMLGTARRLMIDLVGIGLVVPAGRIGTYCITDAGRDALMLGSY